jgi:hypothetical protein
VHDMRGAGVAWRDSNLHFHDLVPSPGKSASRNVALGLDGYRCQPSHQCVTPLTAFA